MHQIVKLYRAMCPREFQDMSNNQLSWNSRFKWFSPDINFIQNRVQDNKFNNSNFCPDRYAILVAIEIENSEPFIKSNFEWMLDRRKANHVKIVDIQQVK